MRFKTDEYLPVEVTEMLRQHQHDALSVHDQQIAGQADPGIVRVCQTEARALVTCDLDCADILAYPPDNYHGIIVLRPAIQSVASLVRLTRRALPLLDVEPLDGHILVVDDRSSSPDSGSRIAEDALMPRCISEAIDRLAESRASTGTARWSPTRIPTATRRITRSSTGCFRMDLPAGMYYQGNKKGHISTR